MSIKAFAVSKVGIGVIASITGLTIGAASASGSPESTTKTDRVEVEKIVTEEVEVTPEACSEAIQYARDGFGIAAESMGYMGDFARAVGVFDVDAMEQAADDMEDIAPRLEIIAPQFNSAAAECEG